MGDTYNPTANFRLVVAHRALASPCAVASCPTSRFSRRRSSRQALFCDSSRRTTDADPHLVVSEIYPFAKTERGRIAKPYHLSIATAQCRSEVGRRKRKQFVSHSRTKGYTGNCLACRAWAILAFSTKAGSRRICRA